MDAGAEVLDVELPETEQFLAAYPIITVSEAYETHRQWFEHSPELYQPATAALLAAQRDRPAAEYLHAARTVERLRRQLFPGFAASWGWTHWSPRHPSACGLPGAGALGGSGGGPNPVAAHVHPVQRARHSGHLGTGTGVEGDPIGIQVIGLPTTAAGTGRIPRSPRPWPARWRWADLSPVRRTTPPLPGSHPLSAANTCVNRGTRV
ncbi:hypothetical protein GS584_21885 [Rhodococcus hoagii]|nr:hypothetical protein [Prescottella equi]